MNGRTRMRMRTVRTMTRKYKNDKKINHVHLGGALPLQKGVAAQLRTFIPHSDSLRSKLNNIVHSGDKNALTIHPSNDLVDSYNKFDPKAQAVIEEAIESIKNINMSFKHKNRLLNGIMPMTNSNAVAVMTTNSKTVSNTPKSMWRTPSKSKSYRDMTKKRTSQYTTTSGVPTTHAHMK